MVTSCQIIFFTFGLFVDLISLRIGRSILTTPQGVESLTSFYVVNLSARQKKRHTHLVGPSKLIETPSSGLKLRVGILQEIQLLFCIDLQQIIFSVYYINIFHCDELVNFYTCIIMMCFVS